MWSHGKFELQKPPPLLGLEWDADGQFLATAQIGEPDVTLWDFEAKTAITVGTTGKEVTFLQWSPTEPILAIATVKGLVFLYNKQTKEKQTVLGSHTRAIRCGAWGPNSVLALGNEERIVSLITGEGRFSASFTSAVRRSHGCDPIATVETALQPSQISFAKFSNASPTQAGQVFSVLLGGQSVCVYTTEDTSEALEISLDQGFVKQTEWADERTLIIGYSSGCLSIVGIDVKAKRVNILSSQKIFVEYLDGLTFATSTGKLAIAGEGIIRVINAENWSEVTKEGVMIQPEDGRIARLDWSPDGQLLSFCTSTGYTCCYTSWRPSLAAAHESRIIHAVSLTELSLFDARDASCTTSKVKVEFEPKLAFVGPRHCAVGTENMLCYFRHDPCKGEYLKHLTQILNDRIVGAGLAEEKAAVLAGGRLFPDSRCTRVAFLDNNYELFLHNPCTETCVRIGRAEPATKVLWDNGDMSSVFVCCTDEQITTHVYMPHHVRGEAVHEVAHLDICPNEEREVTRTPCVTRLPKGAVPLTLLNGIIYYKLPNGKLSTCCLQTHSAVLLEHKGTTPEKALPKFLQLLSLNRLKEAFHVARDCLGLQTASESKCQLARKIWELLGAFALEQLDLNTAEKAFQRIPRPEHLLWLKDVRAQGEEKLVLRGNVYIHLEEFEKAEECFLKSEQPTLALDLLIDLCEWERALKLAQNLDPRRLPYLNFKYAQMLEGEGRFQQALRCYEKAREKRANRNWGAEHSAFVLPGESSDRPTSLEKENMQSGNTQQSDPGIPPCEASCLAGIARCAIRTGEIQRGMQVAIDLGDPKVLADSAVLLEKLKQLLEAAALYEKAGNLEKAAGLYIQSHEFEKAAPLMNEVDSPGLLLTFAKAKEEEGCLEDAVEAYKRAKHYQAAVKIWLYKLGEEEKAFNLVRTSKSVAAAEVVSEFCRKRGMLKEAIEFMVATGRVEEALGLAEEKDQVEHFVQSVGDQTQPEIQRRIGVYFENQNLLQKAARHYAACGDAAKALELYLQEGEHGYDAAIDLVGRLRDPELIEPLFKCLEALGNHMEAAKGACRLARREQACGHYKAAHDVLFGSWKDLKAQNLPVPQELFSQLSILHSYILVRRLMRAGDFTTAAHLLERVSENIQEFEAHAAPILTSAILLFQRANMRQKAHKYSCQLLVRPERRQNIPEKHRRTVETCARKAPPSTDSDPGPKASPCPYCGSPLPDFTLECAICLNVSPFCIASGRHLVVGDCSRCPHCDFPARATSLQDLLSVEQTCPMCEEQLHPGEVQIVDVASFLKKTTRPSQEATQANGTDVAPEDTSKKLEVVEDSVDIGEAAPSFDCGGKPALHEEKD
ncbi:tetratricopeptide repeat-containing protein [Cystoisospora suis]|uniref:Tetratricopeptide repeat-containing protein n=1 Tax=Cystoisospora suis TaxID=483139 RepID=A0A2C6KGZ0_9APIC|nr:tetratricopeptide repeat-containing protein [Cystoisospora suis]